MKAATLSKRTEHFVEFASDELTKAANSFVGLRTFDQLKIPTNGNQLSFAMRHLFAKRTCSASSVSPKRLPKVYKLPIRGVKPAAEPCWAHCDQHSLRVLASHNCETRWSPMLPQHAFDKTKPPPQYVQTKRKQRQSAAEALWNLC
ncbi:MAG: hypothetical protein ACTS4V_00610 [Candidatus Hodgkinia cicadicola]